MSVHLVNPSDNSFGTAVITPRWLFVLAAATPPAAGDPILVDESLEQIVPESIHAGRYCRHQRAYRKCFAWIRGRSHGARSAARGSSMAAFTPRCIPKKHSNAVSAHAVVKGDGDIAWGKVVTDCLAGKPDKNLRRRPD